ncbi:MAG: FmdB family zinc ribbon protein [Gemmatimonadales bacterium]
MPTYDYECPKGHRFEAVQKMSAKPVATCPKCRSRARRVISGGGGFLLKGEGFYKTDYRSEDYKKKASAEAGTSSESSAKAEKPDKGKAERDPAGKSKAKSEAKS